MTDEPLVTLVGNLTGDPELKFLPSGVPVVNFTIAQTPRSFDRQANEWKDGETVFMRCTAWRQTAENIAETLKKGYRAVVYGRLVSRSWDAQDGTKRTSMEVQVEEAGPSLKFVTAQIRRADRDQPRQQQAQPQGDPWAQPPPVQPQQQPQQGPPQQANQGWAQPPQYDAPPF